MRYVLGFLCVCALGVTPLVGCSETTGDGGSGGSAGTGGSGGTGGMPECQNPEDCDDGQECTADVCADGMCEYTPLADGTACDESNECTTGMCASGQCHTTAVQDGSPCAGETLNGNPRGGCYGGFCNFVPVSVTIGAKEVVFDYTTDRCDYYDFPDSTAHVVRADDGELVLFAAVPSYRLSRGADFDSLQRVCDPPALVSADLRTPESYENQEWLWTPYREGANWHVLIHNEFHDTTAPYPCRTGDPHSTNPCWYNSVTYAVSTDDARSFVKPGAPAHVVAPAPRLWVPPPPDAPYQRWYAEGYLAPSNIVHGPDDYYYTLFRAIPGWDLDLGGACLMRTKSLDEPASWRAWNGTDFSLPLTSPYVAGSDVQVCEFLEAPDGPMMHDVQSLTYNAYLERYMAVGTWGAWVGDQYLCGIFFSLSLDLIHWSHTQLIAETIVWCDRAPDAPGLLEPVAIGYPSIIDHEDPTTNFEHPGRTPYLYYTRPNGGLDRDLVRVPLTFTLEE